jgi:cytochrome c oxidase subunit IV
VKLNDHKIKIYTLIWLFIFVITNGYKFYIFKVDY